MTYKLYAVQHIFHPNIHIIIVVVGFGTKSLTKIGWEDSYSSRAYAVSLSV